MASWPKLSLADPELVWDLYCSNSSGPTLLKSWLPGSADAKLGSCVANACPENMLDVPWYWLPSGRGPIVCACLPVCITTGGLGTDVRTGALVSGMRVGFSGALGSCRSTWSWPNGRFPARKTHQARPQVNGFSHEIVKMDGLIFYPDSATARSWGC